MDIESWIVDACYDKGLEHRSNIVKVIYTHNKEARAIISRKQNGMFAVTRQRLVPLGETDAQFFGYHGYDWQECDSGTSLFSTEKSAESMIISEPWFTRNEPKTLH